MVSLISRVDTAHRDMIHDAAMDYYGLRVATCSSDRAIKIFEVKPSGQSVAVAELHGHEGPVWQLSWAHPSFQSILASASYDHKVILWKETGGKWAKLWEYTGHEASVNGVAFGPHQLGCVLASASADQSLAVIVCQPDGSFAPRRIPKAHEQGVNAVSWAPALPPRGNPAGPPQQRLVSGGNDNLVKVWRCGEDGEWGLERALEGHQDWVRDVAWAPVLADSAAVVASAGQDRRVFLWTQPEPGAQWTRALLPVFPDVVWHLSWSVCGTILAVSCGDNKVSLWKESKGDGGWVCISESDKEQDK